MLYVYVFLAVLYVRYVYFTCICYIDVYMQQANRFYVLVQFLLLTVSFLGSDSPLHLTMVKSPVTTVRIVNR